jgi:hypothetical protein
MSPGFGAGSSIRGEAASGLQDSCYPCGAAASVLQVRLQ